MPIEVDDKPARQKAETRYTQAMHGVQTGIAVLIEHGDQLASPKHLRVGIDSVQVSIAALAGLLIKKGLFTHLEYVEALADEAEKERSRLEVKLSALMDAPIKLE